MVENPGPRRVLVALKVLDLLTIQVSVSLKTLCLHRTVLEIILVIGGTGVP